MDEIENDESLILFTEFEQSIKCKDNGRGYVPTANAINLEMVKSHNFETLSPDQIGKLADALYEIAFRNQLESAPKIPSDKETLKLLNKLVMATNRLSELAKSDDPISRRVRYHFESQHVKDELGDTISVCGWLQRSIDMADAARNARDHIENPSSEPDEYVTALFGKFSSGHEWITELKGNRIPSLYFELYPRGTTGGQQGSKNKLEGPLYTFVGLIMSKLEFGEHSNESIRKAIQKVGIFTKR